MKKSFPLVATLSAVACILLAIVDLRRGFLFPGDTYSYKSPFFIFSIWQLVMIALAAMTVGFFRKRLSSSGNKTLLFGIFVILIGDFILYRGVAMERSLAAGKIGLDWMNAFGKTGFLRSFFLSISYLLTVWHATFLSCLVGGLGLLALPLLAKKLSGANSGRAGIMGTFFSFTQPFCSCCIAVTAPSVFSTSLPRSFGLSVLLGAPLLNLSTLILAGNLLPWKFALIRIVGGLLITAVLGIAISWFLRSENEACAVPLSVVPELPPAEDIVTQWFRLSGRLALWLFPSIIFGVMVTSVLWQFWPANFTNSLFSVGFVSVFGTLLMISTWSEIPLTLQMLESGLNGPAAAALIALPAVNLASLLLIGKSTQLWKMVFLMGGFIMLASFLTGLLFL